MAASGGVLGTQEGGSSSDGEIRRMSFASHAEGGNWTLSRWGQFKVHLGTQEAATGTFARANSSTGCCVGASLEWQRRPQQ